MLLDLFSYCTAEQWTNLVPQSFHFACNHWLAPSNLSRKAESLTNLQLHV